ncbi:MAG: hypothetical protein R3F23_08940 [Verrucomicrobiia bacterium]
MPPEPTPDEIARGWQGPNQPRYPKQDLMANTVVPQGTKIYSLQYVDNHGHLVGGDYFFTEDEFKRYLADVKEERPDAYRRLNERLQIGPKLDYDNNLYQYKPHLVEYEVKYRFRAAQGISTENKQFGAGGGEQLFIDGARTLEGYGVFEKTGRVITPKPNEVVALNTSNLKKFDKNAKKIEPKPPEGRLLVNEYSTLSAAEVADIKLTPNHLHVTEGTRLKPGDLGIVEYGPIKHFHEILANQPSEILEKIKLGTLPIDKIRSQRSIDVEAALASHSRNMPNSVDQATFDHVPQTPIRSSNSSISSPVDAEAANQPPEILGKTKVGTLPIDKTPSQNSVDVEAAIASAGHSRSMPNSVDHATLDHVPQTPIQSSDSSINSPVDAEASNNKTQSQPQHSSNATEPTSHTIDKTHTVVSRTNQASQGVAMAVQAFTGDIEGAVNTTTDIAKQKALQVGAKSLAKQIEKAVENGIIKRLVGKVPLGVGMALSVSQLKESCEEVIHLRKELAKLQSGTPEYEKMQVALSRAERSNDLLAASVGAGVVPGEGTIVSEVIDVANTSLTIGDIISDYIDEQEARAKEINEKLDKLSPGDPEYNELIKQSRELHKEWLEDGREVVETIPVLGQMVQVMEAPIKMTNAAAEFISKGNVSDKIELFVKNPPGMDTLVAVKDEIVKEFNDNGLKGAIQKRAANIEKVFQGILSKLDPVEDLPQKKEQEEEEDEKEKYVLKR